MTATTIDSSLATERNGYLVTTGRTSGLPRETEIWFITGENAIHVFSGEHNNKDWFRNLQKTPQVRFRIRDTWFDGTARIDSTVGADRTRLEQEFNDKYYGGQPSGEHDWPSRATLVTIDLA